MDGKLKLSAFNSSVTSPHTKSKLGMAELGMVLHHTHWPISERRTWTSLLLLGIVVLYMVRTSVPVAIVEISQELNWDKKTCVS